MIKAMNPATGETIGEYAEMSADEVRRVIDDVHRTFLEWQNTSFAQRATPLRAAATILRDTKRAYAELMACEMGKPVSGGLAEVEKCALACEHFATHAETYLRPELIESDARRSYVTYRPLGVLLAVMPWNFPFWQVFRFAVQALMAGNTAVLKHASNVPGCALAIEKIFQEAGFPKDAFRSLLIGAKAVDAVLADPRIMAVSLTGSTPAGRSVASRAGALLKKCVLELGGSDPYVILEDADLDLAVPACVTARLVNTGQSCIAAKRFVVVESIREEFERRLTAGMKAAKMGDPLEDDTIVGPMARADLRDELHDQVARSIARGARCVLGGEIPSGPGAFYPPTILTKVVPGMPAYDEELFGPVAAVIAAADEEDAIRIANDTPFGLGAAVFTKDATRGERIAAERLNAGSCFVNAFVRSDPRLPFGGVKESGFGRELGAHGIRELTNVKTVWIR